MCMDYDGFWIPTVLVLLKAIWFIDTMSVLRCEINKLKQTTLFT